MLGRGREKKRTQLAETNKLKDYSPGTITDKAIESDYLSLLHLGIGTHLLRLVGQLDDGQVELDTAINDHAAFVEGAYVKSMNLNGKHAETTTYLSGVLDGIRDMRSFEKRRQRLGEMAGSELELDIPVQTLSPNAD